MPSHLPLRFQSFLQGFITNLQSRASATCHPLGHEGLHAPHPPQPPHARGRAQAPEISQPGNQCETHPKNFRAPSSEEKGGEQGSGETACSVGRVTPQVQRSALRGTAHRTARRFPPSSQQQPPPPLPPPPPLAGKPSGTRKEINTKWRLTLRLLARMRHSGGKGCADGGSQQLRGGSVLGGRRLWCLGGARSVSLTRRQPRAHRLVLAASCPPGTQLRADLFVCKDSLKVRGCRS